MKNLQSLFVVVLLVASSIGILMLPSEQGGRMIAAMFGKLKPASETQRVLQKLKEAERQMVEVIVEREFLQSIDTTPEVDVDGMKHPEHRELVVAGGALKRAAVVVREKATLRKANQLAELHNTLQEDFLDEASRDFLKFNQPLPLEQLSESQKSMLAKTNLVLPRVPSSPDAVAERSGR